MTDPQKITTFLWFDDNAEEAMDHYTGIFENSKITRVVRKGAGGTGEPGSMLVGNFQLEGRDFAALNGGPLFKFTEAISLVVNCDSQDEVDTMWAKLSEGGSPSRCGWLKDRFGLSWQIIPRRLPELLGDPDPDRARRAMAAMMKMTKIDIAALERAADER